jgi:hypothetical protein
MYPIVDICRWFFGERQKAGSKTDTDGGRLVALIGDKRGRDDGSISRATAGIFKFGHPCQRGVDRAPNVNIGGDLAVTRSSKISTGFNHFIERPLTSEEQRELAQSSRHASCARISSFISERIGAAETTATTLDITYRGLLEPPGRCTSLSALSIGTIAREVEVVVKVTH